MDQITKFLPSHVFQSPNDHLTYQDKTEKKFVNKFGKTVTVLKKFAEDKICTYDF